MIHEVSGGIPRIVSVLCDNSLLNGFAAGRQPVGSDIVSEVIRDFDLKAAASEPSLPNRDADDPPGNGSSELLQVMVPTETASVSGTSSEGEPFKPVSVRRRFSLFG